MKSLVLVSIAAIVAGGAFSTATLAAPVADPEVIQIAEAQTEESGLWSRVRNMFRKQEKQHTTTQAQGGDAANQTREQQRTRTEQATAAGGDQAQQERQQTRERAQVRTEEAAGKQAGTQE